MNNLIEKLKNNQNLSDDEFKVLLESDEFDNELIASADEIRQSVYGKDVYIRGLIEFTNYCKNDCYYCGIRCSNKNAERYRLTIEEILNCCKEGYKLGFRTFVLQGGEDPYFNDERMVEIITAIRKNFEDCAITLSIGEKSYDTYKKFYGAGADRYLLRHETADCDHYSKLHPENLSAKARQQCLFDLKEIGFQVGSGFMVGSPYQTTENLIADLRFLQKLQPDMIGIGPFIHHNDTPFKDCNDGTLELTVRLVAILRHLFPYALIPATTALGTISPNGREKGLKAGANVVMPNLSPKENRDKYLLYENKICIGEDLAMCRGCIDRRVESVGYKIVTDRGDVKSHTNHNI